MSSAPAKQNEFLTEKYINGVYIPSGLLVVGCLIVKKEWVPYAVVLALVLGGYKIFSNRVQKVLKPTEFQNFELKEKTIISHNVAIYRFKLPSPTSILGLPIGQHISIAADLPQPDGKPNAQVMRSYTPISGDHQPGYFDLLIKSYPTGNISKYMASLIVGQTIKVRGPKGAMVYTPNMVRHFGMIAGGTGITPMLQIIKSVIRGRPTGDTTEIDLIFANVNPEDILLKEDLDELAKTDKGFRIHYVLNNPPEKWEGGVGFVTPEMMKKWLPAAASDVKLLLCGPPPMISAMKGHATALGFDVPKGISKLDHQVFAF